MKNLSFTVINHSARQELALTFLEYILCDMIYHLANNPKNKEGGWAYATKTWLSDNLSISRRQIIRIFEKLIDKKLIEKHENSNKLYRTTKLWYSKAILDKKEEKCDKMSQNEESVTKCHEKCDKMSQQSVTKCHTNNNNNKNKNNTPPISPPAGGSKKTRKKKSKLTTDQENQVNELMEVFYLGNNSTISFGRLGYRYDSWKIIKKFGLEEAKKLAQLAVAVSGKPYAPVITNPTKLLEKLADLAVYFERKKEGAMFDQKQLENFLN